MTGTKFTALNLGSGPGLLLCHFFPKYSLLSSQGIGEVGVSRQEAITRVLEDSEDG